MCPVPYLLGSQPYSFSGFNLPTCAYASICRRLLLRVALLSRCFCELPIGTTAGVWLITVPIFHGHGLRGEFICFVRFAII